MSSTRRSFLGAAAAATSSLALPAVTSPFRRATARGPDDKARLMVIGVAGRGGANLNGVKDQDIKVLCDIDAKHLQKAAEKFPEAQTCADYREVLEDAEAVAVDAHGNIALTGRFSSQLVIDGLLLQATSLTTRDIFAVLLAPDLTPLWGKAFGGSSLNDGGLGVAFSPSFDVGIVGGLRSTANFGGMSLTSQGEADLFVACFAP